MSDVFISYSRNDKSRVELVRRCLLAHGMSVSWDQDFGLNEYAEEKVLAEIKNAKAVLVCWSDSARTRWVIGEANEAEKQHKYVGCVIAAGDPPLSYSSKNCALLRDWQGEANARPFLQVLREIGRLCHREDLVELLAAHDHAEARSAAQQQADAEARRIAEERERQKVETEQQERLRSEAQERAARARSEQREVEARKRETAHKRYRRIAVVLAAVLVPTLLFGGAWQLSARRHADAAFAALHITFGALDREFVGPDNVVVIDRAQPTMLRLRASQYARSSDQVQIVLQAEGGARSTCKRVLGATSRAVDCTYRDLMEGDYRVLASINGFLVSSGRLRVTDNGRRLRGLISGVTLRRSGRLVAARFEQCTVFEGPVASVVARVTTNATAQRGDVITAGLYSNGRSQVNCQSERLTPSEWHGYTCRLEDVASGEYVFLVFANGVQVHAADFRVSERSECERGAIGCAVSRAAPRAGDPC